MANSVLLWKGPSAIDGAPIALVATELKKASSNTKTGGMVQTYIIRSDVSPVDAIHTGADSSIAGACPHRGDIVPATDGAHATKNVNRAFLLRFGFSRPVERLQNIDGGQVSRRAPQWRGIAARSGACESRHLWRPGGGSL